MRVLYFRTTAETTLSTTVKIWPTPTPRIDLGIEPTIPPTNADGSNEHLKAGGSEPSQKLQTISWKRTKLAEQPKNTLRTTKSSPGAENNKKTVLPAPSDPTFPINDKKV